MVGKRGLWLGIALAMGATAAQAQEPSWFRSQGVALPPIVRVQAVQDAPMGGGTASPGGVDGSMGGSAGGEPSSLGYSQAGAGVEGQRPGESPDEPQVGPTPVKDVKFLSNLLFGEQENPPLTVFGWINGGYTYGSNGPGKFTIAPVQNRYSNEFLLDQMYLHVAKDLTKEWSWGFNMDAQGGADSAIINPTAGAFISNPNPRMNFQFNDLNLTFHAPILTEGGVDFKIGRQTTVLGSQAQQAPWRVFYSSDYQWFVAEEGRFTGAIAKWYITKQLDWYVGITEGWGTFFLPLNHTPSWITQINYWLQEEKKTLFTVTLLGGPQGPDPHKDVPEATSGHGQGTYVWELRLTQYWNKNFYQILQTNSGYSGQGFGGLGVERFYNCYLYNVWALNDTWNLNSRIEWYDDVDGNSYPGGFGSKGPGGPVQAIGKPNQYYECTVGCNYHPSKWIEFRPECRCDWSGGTKAFGNLDAVGLDGLHRSQLTCACDFIIKF